MLQMFVVGVMVWKSPDYILY